MNRLKILILSSALVTLTGCSTLTNMWDAYFMAKYDTNEYKLISDIRTTSELSKDTCADQNVSKNNFDVLYAKSLEFKNFTQYIPDNEDAHKLAKELISLTKTAKEFYNKNEKVSTPFCQLRLGQINRSSEKIQEVLGRKPR